MKSYPKSLLVIALTISMLVTKSQKIGVDSKGKSIFTHIGGGQEKRLEVSAEEPLSVSLVFKLVSIQYVLADDKQTKTINTFRGFFGQVSVLNSDGFLSLSDLSKFCPGLRLKFSYQRSIELFNNIDKIPSHYRGASTTGVNFVFYFDNINIYNYLTSNAGKEYPLTYEIEGNYIFFIRNGKVSFKKIVISLNASLLRTWNDDDLINYQKIDNVTVLPDIVALEHFEGRFGVLDRNIDRLRLSFAVPMYFSIFNPIPNVLLRQQHYT